MLSFAIPLGDLNPHVHYKPHPAIYKRAVVAEGGPLPCFGGSGTGGVESVSFVMSRQGYSPYTVLKVQGTAAHKALAPYAELMKQVKTGFGRTMSNLPAVFGVSRQTLYNWLNGETPKEQHQNKLIQLAAAAQAFTTANYKPTPLSLERTVAESKSFLELIKHGADGAEAARKLIRLEKRGLIANAKLDALLGNRTSLRPEIDDMGRPAFIESV